MGDREVAGWVWSCNVRPALALMAHYVGYRFDETDWQAVEAALLSTDADAHDGWYEYPLVGEPRLSVRLARDAGADPVQLRVLGEMDQVLAARVETVLDVLAEVRAGG